MYVYENERNGHRHETPTRNKRLDALANWRLVAEPEKPARKAPA